MHTIYTLENASLLLIALIVLWLGRELNDRIGWLESHNIPMAVSGGLLCSSFTALLYFGCGIQINFNMELRDVLLLGFFSSVGLAAKFKNLIAGGKTLMILLLCAIGLLIVQDIVGISIAMLFDVKPAYGLFAGSISFAGGHGTAIAWGSYMQEQGLKDAENLGMAAATLGLITGGILGGLVSGHLIKKHALANPHSQHWRYKIAEESEEEMKQTSTPLEATLATLFCLTLCVVLGHDLNLLLVHYGIQLPEFLTALIVGITVTNVTDLITRPLHNRAINHAGELCLHLFLVMSLMSIQLWTLAHTLGPLLIVLAAQMIVITLIVTYIVFHFTGRDYDAAVICGGFIGLGMGATPVAMANMQAITGRYGPSPKAFMVVPLVGAFFIDLSNAVVIKLFAALPFLQQGLVQ